MTNRDKLRGKIAERGVTNKFLAAKCGITQQAFSSKMTGKTEFTGFEMAAIKNALQMTDEEFMTIFFAEEVA